MSYNKVLTDDERTELQPTIQRMQSYWPEMYLRKIAASMVQFAYVYKLARDFEEEIQTSTPYVLSAGSHEDIATECLKLDGFAVVGVDPVWNCELHPFRLRYTGRPFDMVISASVLEHTENDEEFIDDSCALLSPGGFGIFTMDFKDDWRPGQPVPYTSRRFYTSQDLLHRLPAVLTKHHCRLLGDGVYTKRDSFVWDGINYSFASFVFKKDG